jgi:hypothetical protein
MQPNEDTEREIVREFMKQIRPLDLLVFHGSNFVSTVISKLESATSPLGDGTITHVEVAITREWCPKIKKIKAKTTVDDSPQTMLSWGSTMSGSVADAETGKSTFGVQMRVMEDLLLKYLRSPNANAGVCRLLNNPIENPDVDKEFLKSALSAAYKELNGRSYNANPVALLGSLFPAIRPLRKVTDTVMGALGSDVPDWVFCSELCAHIYIAAGVITDSTDGVIDGKILDPADVVPCDFVGGDADGGSDEHHRGIVNRICSDPIWIKEFTI